MQNLHNYIEATEVVKQYDGHLALDHVSLSVPQGCIYGLLGPNGAGKTTLIRILNAITRPDSGTVSIDGHLLTADDVRNIGYLPEERGLYKKMKVADHIEYLARLKGMTRQDARRECSQWLERLGLSQWAGKKVEALSKGMQQKVQFIATVIHRPSLLIFDEPFSGFDPVNAELLKSEILRLGREGATILFSTHNMGSVEEICERITLINRSRAVLEGSVKEIRQRHKKHLYTVTVAEGEAVQPCHELFEFEPPAAGSEGVRLRLNSGTDVRQAVAWLNEHNHLTGFSELLPSMNEIFIDTVNQLNNTPQQ